MKEKLIEMLASHLRKPGENQIWCAEITHRPRYAMEDAIWRTQGPVQLAEVYRNLESGDVYLRIYLLPNVKCVPTIILGENADVSRIARRDGNRIHALRKDGNSPISIENTPTFRYWKEIGDLLGLQHELAVLQQPAYTIRPCSFVMAEMIAFTDAGVPAILKAYHNQLRDDGEKFAHLTNKDEREPLMPEEKVHHLLGTGSERYRRSNQHVPWTPVHQ